MAILPKLIYKFKLIPTKFPPKMTFFFFTEIDKLILKLMGKKCKEPRIAKQTNKTTKAGEVKIPDYKAYCKAVVIKTVW